jgi:hypothetical protein
MRSSIRRAAPSSQTKADHHPLTFVEDSSDPVFLVETRSDGSSQKLQVTKNLVETYIENDYQTHPISTSGTLKQPDHEAIKLLYV